MDKIIVPFEDIRGLGNIINPKSLSDFDTYKSNVSEVTDIVNGIESTVYSMGYNGGVINLSASETYISLGETVLLTAMISLEEGSVEGKTITFKQNGNVIGNDVTDVNGVATFTVSNFTMGNHQFTAHSNNINSDVVNVFCRGTEYIEFTANGTTVASTDGTIFEFTGSGLFIDWGDGDFEEYKGGYFSHTYDTNETHTFRIYGSITKIKNKAFYGIKNILSMDVHSPLTHIGDNAFYAADNILEVHFPTSLQSIGYMAFTPGNRAIHMYFDWTESSKIIGYSKYWVMYSEQINNQKIHIPYGTTSLYTAKGYPSKKLIEADPIFDGITLTSDKDIISYNGGTNPDVATLTAQLTNNGEPIAISDETVTFEVRKQSDDSLIETLTGVTDSSGVASVGYTSKGAGDIYIKAECIFVSETYSIEDMFKYDDATSDKSNKFSFISNPNASSISHQTDYYQVNYTRTAEANPVKINLAEFVCEDDFEASIDVYYTASSTKQFTWKISGNSNFVYNNMSEIGSWSTSRILRTFVGTQSYSSNPSGHLPQSTWLTFKFKKQNGNILLRVYNGSTLINEYSSVEWEQSTTIIMGLQLSEYINTFRFKNLKVKPL